MWTREGFTMLIWQAHKGKIESAAFSPDGLLLATATGSTRAPYLWEPTSGKLVRRLEGSVGAVKAVAFAPDAPLFAAGTERNVIVWSTDTWEVLAELPINYAFELAFGPGKTPMLAAGGAQHVLVWTGAGTSARPRKPTQYLTRSSVAALHFSADGALLAMTTCQAAGVWRTADRKRLLSLRSAKTNSRGAVRISPDVRKVAIAYGKWVEVWPVAENESGPLVRIEAGTGRAPIIWTVNWTADGNALLTAGNDGFVRVWDSTSGAELKAFDWKIGKLYCAAFSPDGLTCAACGAKGQVVIWDVDE
jgi:WD40 repeat protein